VLFPTPSMPSKVMNFPPVITVMATVAD
jgi:hypothetical protein